MADASEAAKVTGRSNKESLEQGVVVCFDPLWSESANNWLILSINSCMTVANTSAERAKEPVGEDSEDSSISGRAASRTRAVGSV